MAVVSGHALYLILPGNYVNRYNLPLVRHAATDMSVIG